MIVVILPVAFSFFSILSPFPVPARIFPVCLQASGTLPAGSSRYHATVVRILRARSCVLQSFFHHASNRSLSYSLGLFRFSGFIFTTADGFSASNRSITETGIPSDLRSARRTRLSNPTASPPSIFKPTASPLYVSAYSCFPFLLSVYCKYRHCHVEHKRKEKPIYEVKS